MCIIADLTYFLPLGLAMTSPIEALPLEIQQNVLTYLSTYDLSLRAFAYTNRACHTVASPFLYHTLKVGLDPNQRLAPNFYTRMQNHQAILRLRYVRCILVYDINAEADSIGLNSKGAGLRSLFLIGNPTNFNGCLQSDSLYHRLN